MRDERVGCQNGSRERGEQANGERSEGGKKEGRGGVLKVVCRVDSGGVCRLW
jgi:hypothetical protein